MGTADKAVTYLTRRHHKSTADPVWLSVGVGVPYAVLVVLGVGLFTFPTTLQEIYVVFALLGLGAILIYARERLSSRGAAQKLPAPDDNGEARISCRGDPIELYRVSSGAKAALRRRRYVSCFETAFVGPSMLLALAGITALRAIFSVGPIPQALVVLSGALVPWLPMLWERTTYLVSEGILTVRRVRGLPGVGRLEEDSLSLRDAKIKCHFDAGELLVETPGRPAVTLSLSRLMRPHAFVADLISAA